MKDDNNMLTAYNNMFREKNNRFTANFDPFLALLLYMKYI